MAYTKQNTRVERFQGDTDFNDSGTATAVRCTAFLQTKLLVNDSDSTDKVPAPWKPVNCDLLAAPVATTNYTAAGKTVNGLQLAALLREVFLSEANRQGIS